MEWTPEKACCFTGHRKIPVEDRLRLCCLLDDAITSLADRGVDTFLAGGALGFDTLAAQEVLRLRQGELPWIRLVLVLPCLGQEARWRPEDARLYFFFIDKAY